jgi:hypothetical protein
MHPIVGQDVDVVERQDEKDPGNETGGYVRVLLLYAAQEQEQS